MFYISLIPFIVLLIYDLKKSLHMAQQNLYNDDHRFLKWTLKDIKSFKTPLKCSLVVLITYLILLVFKLEASVITSIYFFVVCLIILLIEIKENKNADTKIKLKVTARVKRLIFTNVSRTICGSVRSVVSSNHSSISPARSAWVLSISFSSSALSVPDPSMRSLTMP